MAASGNSAAAIIIALLHLSVTVAANDVSLEILPSADPLSKSVGSKFLLTCKPNVSTPNTISYMKWLDPQGNTIEPFNSENAAPIKPDMYVESHVGDSLALYFNSLKEMEAGRYTCVANYANTQELNKSVTIETIEAIRWIDAPENQYPILGKEFKIKCHVSARPSPTVDWLHNGQLITTSDHYIIETHALKIQNVTESDEGVYTCRASVLTTGELEERIIRVEVLEEPKIEEIRSEIEIIEGRSETITCKASGKPPPQYAWVKYLDRADLSTTDRFGVDKDTGILTITNVMREDEGEYQCRANNTAGEAQTMIKVVVLGKPKIMEFLNRTTAVGRNIEITCKAYGKPLPEVRFRKESLKKPYVTGAQPDDDRIIMTSISDNAKSETVATLQIDKVLRDDDGLYECIANNKVSPAYRMGHLTVEFPPSFALMTNKTVFGWEGKPLVNLTCLAESIPNATIRWMFRNQNPVEQYSELYTQIDEGAKSTLVVRTTDSRPYGHYRCIAKNSHGEREITIHLLEGTRPGMIQQARVLEFTATTMRFAIEPPASQEGLMLKGIRVQYKELLQPWSSAKNKTWSVGANYVVEDLKPATEYKFRFLAFNEVGDGNWADILGAIMTSQKKAPNPPNMKRKNADVLYETSPYNNQYHLEWFAPPDNGEQIDMYEIRYCQVKRVGQEWQMVEGSCRALEIKGQRVKEWLKNLNSETFYEIQVRAHNILGYGEPGVIYVKTARGENVPSRLQGTSSAAIIGIVIAALFLVIIVIDIICCCTHKTGIIFYLCERSKKKPVDEEDTKLGSLYGWRFPLPYCDQKMANVAGVTAIQESSSGKNTIKLVKHTAIEEKEPLREEKKIAPIIDSGLRRETSITFDGKRSVSKTGFVGKDSAV